MAPPGARADHVNWSVTVAMENFNVGRIENYLPTLPTVPLASFDAVRNLVVLAATAFGTRERAPTEQLSKK